MPLRVGQPNFSKGEISEELVARLDVAAYASALRRAENVIILKYGGITKRPGTRLVAEVYKKSIDADFTGEIAGTELTVSSCVGDIAIGRTISDDDGNEIATVTDFGTGTGSNGTYVVTPSQTVASSAMHATVDAPVRLMPFQFSTEQTYALEMGQGYMRAAANGGLVIEDKLTITAITLGATTTIAAAYHDYSIGDQIVFDGITGTIELNGQIGRVVSVVADVSFTVDIDSTDFTPFVSDSGGTTRSGAPPPPPPPPPVPPPSPPPPPPPTGGGGGYDPGDGSLCVADDTMILLADGTETQARFLTVGTMLRTRHEKTLAWGNHPVSAISTAWEPVYKAEGFPRATANHRFWIDGAWKPMSEIGEPDGKAWVSKITVADAHTYVSAGVLSHNIKDRSLF